jgi:carboxymethylenebutenolidase
MATTSVRIPARDKGDFEGWLATPASGKGKGHGMIVLPEVYNANPWARTVAERYAAEGYVAVVPDLYWRQKPAAYMDYNPEGREQAQGMSRKMDLSLFIEDMKACADWLRKRPDCTGKIGSVGFCLGGKLVWLELADKVIDVGVAYYASGIEPHLDAGKRIDRPLMMHFGSLDHRLPRELYDRIEKILEGKPNTEMYWYEGADHAFNRDGYPPYHPEVAKLAMSRTLEFFSKHLGSH